MRIYVDTIVDQLRSQGIRAEAVVVFGNPLRGLLRLRETNSAI